MRIAALVVAGAMLAGSAPFEDASAQWRKRARSADSRSPTPIACTATGCAPIAPGCRIETGFTSDGMLSGYDAVVCPVR
ncbi:MAG TPA: hypothetical protein VD863_06285 [Bradyrhizobium sp.]|nr:hypothetical protein [Bradyrhizobium sp.]